MSLTIEQIQQKNWEFYSESEQRLKQHGAGLDAQRLIYRYRLSRILDQFDPTGKDVLDFGCGTGSNLALVSARRRVGFDLSEAFADQIRATGIEFCSDPRQLEGESFDYVLISHVLEHVTNPLETLATLRRYLKPDGRLCVVIPHEGRVNRFDPGDRDHHLFCWNVQTLTRLLLVSGAKIERCRSVRYSYEKFAANLAVRLGLGYGFFRFVQRTIQMLLPRYEIQLLASFPDGAQAQA